IEQSALLDFSPHPFRSNDPECGIVSAIRSFFGSCFSNIHGGIMPWEIKNARFIFICKALHWRFKTKLIELIELYRNIH
ncbi:MAG: hypothetical protein LBU06_10190, partial [Desulfovibrio sp.]|nr:hypothetical protein [Desulfovibrio sp.]